MKFAPASLFAPLALLASPATAQVVVDNDLLERDLTILAADDMEGREAGTRGHERAAGYVAGRMAALGLEPAGDNGTYFQHVPLRTYSAAESGNTISIEGMDALVPEVDFVVRGGPQVQSGTVTAPLVFVGYALDMPGYDSFEGVDLEGAIAVRVRGGPVSLNSEEAAHFQSSTNQRLSDRGAIGVLTLFTPSMAETFGWDWLVGYLSHSSSMTWIGPDGMAFSQGPNIAGSGYLSEDISRALLDGQQFDFDDLAAAEESDVASLPSFALDRSATITFASEFDDIDSPNVIGMIPGSDPALADEYVVLTAHLDHVGIQPTEEVGDDEIFNGALDNAVGVASMLEVSRLLMETPAARPFLVVALTAEEKGLIGSSYHARNQGLATGQIIANVNLDMPVVTYDFQDVVAFGAERSTLYPAVRSAAEEYGLTLSPDPQPEQGFFTRSDQYSYVIAGIPAVYLDLGFANGGEVAQAVVFSEHYHQPSDEIGLIDFGGLARFTGVNYLIARNVGNMAERPAWLPGDFFGMTFGGAPAAPAE
ncbi:M28 family peptidase [Aurantiacibacter marinus]|nr:M28 family peptidase [Aurantiacibacter marinus]